MRELFFMSLTKKTKLIMALTAVIAFVTLAGIWFVRPTASNLSLTYEEWEWLARNPRIRLGVTPSTRPLEYFGTKAEYKGMVADYIHLLSSRLGVEFEVVETVNLKKLLAKAENREVDMVAAFWANPANIDYMLFTRPYQVIPTVIVVNKNTDRYLELEDMAGMDLALPKSNAVIDYVSKNYPQIHIQPVYNYLAALLHVSFDEIDGTIISLPQASYFIEEKGITNLRVAGHTDYKIYNRIATRSDWPILNSIMQKGLDSISDAEHDRIYRKWITIEQHYISFLLHNKQFWGYLGGGILAVILFIVSIIYWNRTLHKRVHESTKELKKQLDTRVRLMTAVEQSQDGIFIVNTDKVVEYVNPSFEDMSGYAKEELVGGHISVIRSNSREADFYRKIWDLLHQGEVWRGQTTHRDKEGQDYEVDLSISPIYDDESHVTGYVGVARDITERLRMEKQLRQRQKLEELGTLAGGIAHDFNNILAAILGYAELTLPSLEEGSRGHSNVERIQGVARRAKDMVNQILVFSRRRKPTLSRVDMVSLLKEVVNFLRISLPSSIEIRSELNISGACTMGNSTQIHQMITNLGTNAAYAMAQEGGVLTVGMDRVRLDTPTMLTSGQVDSGEYVKITVQDTGTGIPEDVISRIFDPFFTTKPQSEGTGLGLSMVHGTVMSMQGGIDVSSKEMQGTLFTIYLPLEAGSSCAESESKPELVRGKGRVLLVDDEPDMVCVGEQMLTGLGYSVVGMTDSRAALELFRSDPGAFDLLVTDQTMPHLNGDQLVRAIHKERPDLPVILCTGYATPLSTIANQDVVFKSVLIKPFEMSDLSLAVVKALRQ